MNKPVYHKTTQAEFARFKDAFSKTRDLLGLTNWGVAFRLCPIRDSMAEIHINRPPSYHCEVRLSSRIEVVDPDYSLDFEATAVHECCHLFLFQLEHLATCRFVTDSEIDSAVESMTRTLEHAIVAMARTK